MGTDTLPKRLSLLTSTTLHSTSNKSSSQYFLSDYGIDTSLSFAAKPAPLQHLHNNSSSDSIVPDVHNLNNHGHSHGQLRVPHNSILDSSSTLLNINNHSRNFSFESFSVLSDNIEEVVVETIKDDPWVVSFANNLVESIIVTNSGRQRSLDEFFDEFSYNIIMSQLLSERILISQYSQTQSGGGKYSYNRSIQLGQGKSKADKRRLVKLPPQFAKINVTRSNNDLFRVILSPNHHQKLLVLYMQLISLKRKVINNGRVKRLRAKQRSLIVLLAMACLINIKNLMQNKAVYALVSQSKALEASSRFFNVSQKLDLVFKRTALHLKEFIMYSQVDEPSVSHGGASILPRSMKLPVLLSFKNHRFAIGLVAYLMENLSLLTNYYMFKVADKVSVAIGHYQGLQNFKLVFLNYVGIYKINLKALSQAVTAFNVLVSTSANHTAQASWDKDVTLKPLQLALRSPKVSPNIDIGSPSNIGSFADNNNSDSQHHNHNTHINQNLNYHLQNLEDKLDVFHLVRKLLLTLWLIIVNDTPISDETLDKNTASNTLTNDELLVSNIIDTLLSVSHVSSGFHTSTKSDLLSELLKEFESHECFIKEVHSVLLNYFNYNNSADVVSPSRVFQPPKTGHKFNIQNSNDKSKDINLENHEVIENLSINLSRITYKLNKLTQAVGHSEAVAHQQSDNPIKAALHQEFETEHYKQMINNLAVIESDLVKVLNSYQSDLGGFKQKVALQGAMSRQMLRNKDKRRKGHTTNASIDNVLLGNTKSSKSKSHNKRHSLPVGTKFSMMSMSNNDGQEKVAAIQQTTLSSPVHVHETVSPVPPHVSNLAIPRWSPKNKNYKRLSTGLQFSLLKISEDSGVADPPRSRTNSIVSLDYSNDDVGDTCGMRDRSRKHSPSQRVVSYDDNYLGIYSRKKLMSLSLNDSVLSRQQKSSQKMRQDTSAIDEFNSSYYTNLLNNNDTSYYKNTSYQADHGDNEDIVDEGDDSKDFSKEDLEKVLNAKFEVMINNMNDQQNDTAAVSPLPADSAKQNNDNTKADAFIDRQFFLGELSQRIPVAASAQDEIDEVEGLSSDISEASEEDSGIKHTN